MSRPGRLVLFLVILPALGLGAQTPARFPRIANLYGAALAWSEPARGLPYWSKLGLIAGGGADWHNDYQSRDLQTWADRAAVRAAQARRVNPALVILPYVDVIEGPDNPTLPQNFWLKGDDGKRVSTWPGFWRVDTRNPAVLGATAQAVGRLVFAEPAWDGVFLDCWEPEAVLVPQVRSRGPGKVVMTNSGGFPDAVSPLVNGVLSEDELNRALDGQGDLGVLMDRYHRWMAGSARPAVTTISCYPRTMDADPWRWAQLTPAQRDAALEAGRTGDPAMMRFGLTFTLQDDGYFAYDGGTQARGSWWWYPEYDAPLGKPAGASSEVRSGLWRREFTGASVWCNGSDYDEPVLFDAPMRDVSTGRVARSFVVPRTDGRIFVPADLPAGAGDNGIPADPAGFLVSGSPTVRTEAAGDGSRRWQFPSGFELFLGADGLVRKVAWKGRTVLTGAHPVVVLPPWREVAPAAHAVSAPGAGDGSGPLVWEGTVGWSDPGAAEALTDQYRLTLETGPSGAVTLTVTDRYRARTDWKLQMWRHYVFLPVSSWAGRPVSFGGGTPSLVLPSALGTETLGGGTLLRAEDPRFVLEVASSYGSGLVDHRRYGTPDFLWAGYPGPTDLKAGTELTVVMRITLTPAGP